MASIFKPTGRTKFRIQYTDPETGKQMTVPGFADRKATEAKARDLERRAERIASGLPVANQEKRLCPLTDLIAEHTAEMQAQGLSYRHVKETARLLTAIRTACQWDTLSQFRVARFREYLRNLTTTPPGHNRKKPLKDGESRPKPWPASSRTRNAHRLAMYHFLCFAVENEWLEENPLAGHRAPKSKPVRKRRSYTVEEFKTLCDVAAHNRPLYTIAGLSGFRWGELSRLEKQDLDPHATVPAWRPRAEIVKGRRLDVVPILPDLLPIIRPLWDSLPSPASRLFPTMPANRTFRNDQKRAEINRLDDTGRHADFHSLRYFFCAQLAARMPIQKVQRFMRHKNIKMTSDLYLDLGLTDLWQEMENLPSLNLHLKATMPTVLPLALPSVQKPQDLQEKLA